MSIVKCKVCRKTYETPAIIKNKRDFICKRCREKENG